MNELSEAQIRAIIYDALKDEFSAGRAVMIASNCATKIHHALFKSNEKLPDYAPGLRPSRSLADVTGMDSVEGKKKPNED
jgi:hypothetical protein